MNIKFYLVFLLRLRGKGAEGDDCEDDCEYYEQDRDHGLDVVPDVSACGELCGDRLQQGCRGRLPALKNRDEEHLVVSADVAEPCADSDQAGSGEGLVGCTEGGHILAYPVHAENDDQDNGDCCHEVRIYKGSCRL